MGLLVPQYGATASEALAAARAAEDAGLDVWVAGQLLPMQGSSARTALEPLTLMGAIAAVTETARLGFMVLAAPYLPPLYLAKALLTLDELSAGRLEAGLGAGWREQEFAALGGGRPPLAERLATTRGDARRAAGAGGCAGRVRSLARERACGQRSSAAAGLDRRGRADDAGPGGASCAVDELRPRDRRRGLSREGADGSDAAREAGRPAPGLSLTATFMAGEPQDLAARLAERAARRGIGAAEYERRLRAANVFVGGPGELAEQMREYVGAGCSAFVLWPLDGEHAKVAAQLGAASRALDSA